MRHTRKQLERMRSAAIEARIEEIQKAHLPPDAYQEISQLQSVLYERIHHEAQQAGIAYFQRLRRRWTRRVFARWTRRYLKGTHADNQPAEQPE